MCSNLDDFEKFKNYVNTLENTLDGLVKDLDWDKDFFLSRIMDKTLHICPFDTSHEVNEKNLEHHIRTHHLELETTNSPDDPLPGTSEFFYGSRIPSVHIDKEVQSSIIEKAIADNPFMTLGCDPSELLSRELPQSHADMMVNFSRDEKLALYKYAVEKTGHQTENEISIPVQMDTGGNAKTKMTFAEILAYNRNLKRRRMKYRTTKEPPLSYVEEVRKLILTQMDALEQYLGTGNVSQHSNGEIGRGKQNIKDVKNVVAVADKPGKDRSRNRYRSPGEHDGNVKRRHSKSHTRDRNQSRSIKEKRKRRRERSSSNSISSKGHASKHRSKKLKKSNKKKKDRRNRGRSASD